MSPHDHVTLLIRNFPIAPLHHMSSFCSRHCPVDKCAYLWAGSSCTPTSHNISTYQHIAMQALILSIQFNTAHAVTITCGILELYRRHWAESHSPHSEKVLQCEKCSENKVLCILLICCCAACADLWMGQPQGMSTWRINDIAEVRGAG
jgi:hypothetical protein